MTQPPKRPRDPSQLAKFVIDAVTGDERGGVPVVKAGEHSDDEAKKPPKTAASPRESAKPK